MKQLSVIGLAILIAACSSHAVRCNGSLQPINTPVTGPATAPSGTGSGERRP